VFWGGWGLGVGEKELVRDSLSVIAQVVPRGGTPPWVTAAVPRDLHIDPCEKKSKRREFARWPEGVLPVLPVLPAGRYHCHGVSIAYLLLREAAAKFAKRFM
jgi:hypothetical protein